MNIHTEAQKDQDQLEREIDEQRAHIGDTISALEAQFSPGQMLDKVLSYSRANGGEFAQNLVDTVKRNPVPTIMTALGVAWMMYGQNRSGFPYADGVPSDASYGVDPAYDSHRDSHRSRAGELKDRAVHMKDNVKGSVGNAMHRAGETSAHWRDSASHARHNIRARAHRASDGFSNLLHEQPLAVGAIGLAVGALIAASLPATRTEDRYMGKTRDRASDKLRNVAQEGAREFDELKQDVKRKAGDVKRTAGEASQGNEEVAREQQGVRDSSDDTLRNPYQGYANGGRSDGSPKLNS